MCDFLSFVIDRQGKIWTDPSNSHSTIINLGNGSLDNNQIDKQNSWECEIKPPFDESIPFEIKVRFKEPTKIVQKAYLDLRKKFIQWNLGKDLESIPQDWWDVKDFLVKKGIKNISGVLYEGNYRRLPEGIKIITGNTQIDQLMLFEQIYSMHGLSQVRRMSGSSQVGYMHDSSQIGEMFGSSQIGKMYNSSQVKRMSGSSQVRYMYNSSQIGEMYGSSQIGEMHGSSQVGEMFNSSQVGKMYGLSQVKRMSGSSQIGEMFNSSQVGYMHDSSQVGKMFNSSQVIK